MYYLIYLFFYLTALLPYRVLYAVSDVIVFLMHVVFRYRLDIIMNNLEVAFPEKTIAERRRIARKFYRNFVDTFVEIIKMIRMTDQQFRERCTIDMELIRQLEQEGKSIQFHSGHQFNWEYANWVIAREAKIPFVGVYQVIGSKAFTRFMLKIRGRYGTRLVSTREFRSRMHDVLKGQYCIGLAADQNTDPNKGLWQYFFSKPVPFVTGPEKGAIRNNTAVVFVSFDKGTKRGYYHFSTKLITDAAAGMPHGELTRKYRDLLEETVRQSPDNYLWSHRRWRHPYLTYHAQFWIDTQPNPIEIN